MTMSLATAPVVLHNPVFEGSEKRIEIDFTATAATRHGLRALTRCQLDELMSLAACTIVSSRSNAELDAYVLSESSLFVYPTKFILKTCGTTKLLNCLPRLLEMASAIGLEIRRCKFSRASFLFPEQQVQPHTSFDDEALFLRKHVGHLGHGGCAYVLGDRFNGLQWHIYVADAEGIQYHGMGKPTFNFEVCMTELGTEAARKFFRDETFVSAQQTTQATGIKYLVPSATIDDYVFEPCGYSMNGIQDHGLITIHVTPEEGFSYASVEISGFDEGTFDPSEMLERILKVFNPGKVSVTMSVDMASPDGTLYTWGSLMGAPNGYGCQSATCQELGCGGRVSFYTLTYDGKQNRPKSPVTVLRHMPSFVSCMSSDSEIEYSDGAQGSAEYSGGSGTERCGGAVANKKRKLAG